MVGCGELNVGEEVIVVGRVGGIWYRRRRGSVRCVGAGFEPPPPPPPPK